MSLFSFGVPQTDVREVAERIKAGENFVLLDIREPREIDQAQISAKQVALVPMSEMAARGVEALPEAARDQNADIVVMCHTGQRSTQVTRWLLKQGWKNVRNLTGGIHAYALLIDPSVGTY